jgi:hypothetical protein
VARRRRVEAVRNRCRCRDAKSLWWHIGVFGIGQADLHTAATGRHGDDFIALAAALGAGGAMDEGTTYVEAVGSLR